MSKPFTKRFEKALQYAANLHSTQMRKGTNIPYISHILAVASIVIENGGSEDEAIAALLHDAVEDQGGIKILEEIRHVFGDHVASIVADCTDAWTQSKPPWRERKENYIHHLNEASPSALLVSSADKLHNARTILADYRKFGDDVWRRFKGGKMGITWYYKEIINTYKTLNTNKDIVFELDRVIGDLEMLVKRAEQATGSPGAETIKKT